MRRLSLVLALALLPFGAARAEGLVRSVEFVPTAGGAHVRVEILRDPSLDPQPILLTYSPYNDTAFAGESPPNDFFSDLYVSRGYARAWGDVLGTRGSSGCWDYGGPAEQQSGVDLVNYLAAESWSNGKVAMIGVSYDGTTANEVAVRGTDVPGLAAIVPLSSISRWYEYAYTDGARYNQFGTPPLFDTYFARRPPPAGDPPANQAEAIAAHSPECDAIEHTLRAHQDSPAYDDFWLERDYLKDASKIRVPVLLAHGWQDYNVKQQQGLNMWDAIVNAPFKLLYLFQGTHEYPTGEAWGPLLDAFLDQTLHGIDHGLANTSTPVITQNLAGPERPFASEQAFPPPGTQNITLWPRANGTLATDEGADPVATYTDLAKRNFRGQVNDKPVPDALRYESPPLARDARLAGSVALEADVAVDRARGQLDAVLYDVDESGIATQVAPGALNLQFRNGLATPEPLTAGSMVHARVVIKPQDYTFLAGHQIRLMVSSSNEPFVVPDLPATYTFSQSSSALVLPIVGPGALFS